VIRVSADTGMHELCQIPSRLRSPGSRINRYERVQTGLSYYRACEHRASLQSLYSGGGPLPLPPPVATGRGREAGDEA
jgi:hypothetical protein